MKAKLWVLRGILILGMLVIAAMLIMKFINGEEITISNGLSLMAPIVTLVATFVPDIGRKDKKRYEEMAARYLANGVFEGHAKEKKQFMNGFAFWDQGKYPQAIDCLRRIDKMTEDAAILARSHAHIGRCYLDAEGYSKAAAEYEEALNYDPSFVLAWSNLATVYDRLGSEPEKSVRALENAIFYDPDYEIAYNKLSMYYSMAGNNEKSEWAAKTAIRLNPKRPENHSNLAWTLCAMGRPEEAEQSYLRALQLGYKDNGTLRDMIGNAKILAAQPKPQPKADGGVLDALRQAKYNHDHGIGGPLDEDPEEDDGDY